MPQHSVCWNLWEWNVWVWQKDNNKQNKSRWCIFLQHDNKDKIYSIHWAMDLKYLFRMKQPSVNPKSDWHQHWQKIMYKMYTSKNRERREFIKSGAKKLTWLYSTGIQAQHVMYKVCAFLPSISDQNSKRVKGFTGPFKLETFKRHDKSF